MRIQHNIMAMNAYRNYTNNVSAMKGNLEKLSSGYKINRAGDDAAGLAISEKMRAQITGLQQAQANAKSGINLVQTAEGALQEVQDMLNRMVKLAEQSANGTFDDGVDRNQLQKEFQRLTEEIDRIGDSANFNGITLLDGSLDGGSTTSATKAKVVADAPTVTATAGFKALDTLPTGVTEAKADGATTDGDVTVKVEKGAGDVKAKATDSTVTFEAGEIGDAANEITIEIVKTGETGGATAAWDKDNKKVVVSLGNDGGTSGKYSAANIQTAIQALGDKTADGGVKFGSFSVTDTGSVEYDATGNDADTIKTVELADGDQTAKVTINVDGKDEVKRFDSSGWTSTVTVATDKASVKIDTSKDTGLATAKKVGDVTTSVAKDTEIDIGGVKYTTKGDATDNTAAKALDLAVQNYNKNSTEWTAAVGTGDDAGKIVFTAAKAGAVATTGATAPTGTLTDGTDAGTTGGAGKAMNLQIGDTAHIYNRISVSIKSIKSDDMYDLTTQQQLDAGETVTAMQADGTTPMTAAKKLSEISVDTEDNAREALGALKGMVNYISDIRGELGATQNRLNHTINNLSVMTENIQDAESTIRDTDVADEMMAYTKNNILIQSAQAMLAQANQVPQGVLQLLQ